MLLGLPRQCRLSSRWHSHEAGVRDEDTTERPSFIALWQRQSGFIAARHFCLAFAATGQRLLYGRFPGLV